MASVIRLRRRGRKKEPFYHVVVMDSRNRRDGRSVDQIGFFNPLVDSAVGVRLDKDKAVDWIKKGAKPSQTVKSLFVKHGIMEQAAQTK